MKLGSARPSGADEYICFAIWSATEKTPPAMLHRAASLTLVCVSVLPIRNRLSRKFPQRRPQHAQLMVVNRDLHPSGGKEFDSSFELVLIVMRVDPERVHIARSVTYVFETHQSDMFREW